MSRSRNLNGYRFGPGQPTPRDFRLLDREAAPLIAFTAPGIYAVVCTATGDAYVGSSINVTQRLDGHRNQLRGQTHPNSALLALWNSHGEITFEFRFIERVPSRTKIQERERYWIEQMGTLNKRLRKAS